MIAAVGLFMWIMLNPGSAQGLGLIGQKANFALGGLPPDWSTFLFLIVEMGGFGGLVMVSLIVSFVFGREYAEGTAKNALALPIPRGSFVIAKIVVSAVWFAALTLWLIPVAVVSGSAAGLNGLQARMLAAATGKLYGPRGDVALLLNDHRVGCGGDERILRAARLHDPDTGVRQRLRAHGLGAVDTVEHSGHRLRRRRAGYRNTQWELCGARRDFPPRDGVDGPA